MELSIPLRLYLNFLMVISFGILVAETFPHEGYIPLCVADKTCHVDLGTLKAFKVANEDLALALLKEAGRHTITRKEYFRMATKARIKQLIQSYFK